MKKNIRSKIHNFINWIKKECKDIKTLIVFVIVVIIIYSPVWLGLLLYYIFNLNWCLVMASLTFAFWAGPFTPFFPLCITITLFIKKIMELRKG